ncbi:MAG: hypothetical protein J6B68_10060 [Lachnospiraceae bacterium]|nr:hypothetical protein [Lachnospiraceae bacterium]
MRITNKIMRNNSLYNINQNKILEDKLSSQMTNQSKITRPSDDPVVAIRALRLRTNVTTVSQYYDKNAPDADQWITLTGDALDQVDDVLTDLYKQAADASKKSLKSEDLEIILTQMEALTDEFYACGNVDYAGRYVFSGYRTDTPITFTAEDIKDFTKDPANLKTFEIEESMGYEDFSAISYTDWSNIDDELQVTNTTMYRVRLSYNDVNEVAGGDGATYSFTVKQGNNASTTVNAIQYTDAETAYKAISDGNCEIAYIPSTGEIVFSEAYYQNTNNISEDTKITVSYSKSNWVEGDINPVHYFKCSSDGITYNADGLDQDIFYDVGFNQNIQVNTQAREVFTHSAKRDMDDFDIYLKQLQDIETKITDIEEKMAGVAEDSTDYEKFQKNLDAANKAYTYIRENIQTKFENQITKYQSYIDDTNVAITNNGTRGSRLELISDRLMNQKATFKDLQSSNEDVDVSELAVQLKSSELTYEASLMATSKIMQTNLMNYI